MHLGEVGSAMSEYEEYFEIDSLYSEVLGDLAQWYH